MRLMIVLAAVLNCAGCGVVMAMVSQLDCSNAYVDPAYENSSATSYRVKIDVKTPSGIEVDTSGFDVDILRLDRLVADLEACIDRPIKRCGFRVKIAPDARYQACAGMELFPCRARELAEGCENNACPCGCSGAVQYPSVIVTTPNLASVPHELIHLVLRADQTHSHPAFSKCE